MKARLSRLFLAGGQNAVPITGWFFAGWTPGTTLVVFWFENVQWMLATQVASLALDLWNIGGWPFAELKRRTDWMQRARDEEVASA